MYWGGASLVSGEAVPARPGGWGGVGGGGGGGVADSLQAGLLCHILWPGISEDKGNTLTHLRKGDAFA